MSRIVEVCNLKEAADKYIKEMAKEIIRKENLKIGDVLWQVNGRERDGICKFAARPYAIEYIDDHKILFSDGTGGSINHLGSTWFFTRQEALDDFIKRYKSLEVQLPDLEELEQKSITREERTDFQDYQVCRDDTVSKTTVYLGNVGNLINITDKLIWHSEPCEPLYMDLETLTLSEIWEQAKEFSKNKIITVFVDSALSGTVFQCGNYEDGKWVKYGTTIGYA